MLSGSPPLPQSAHSLNLDEYLRKMGEGGIVPVVPADIVPPEARDFTLFGADNCKYPHQVRRASLVDSSRVLSHAPCCLQMKFSVDHARYGRVGQAAFENIVTWVDDYRFSKLLDQKQVTEISNLFAGSHAPACHTPRTRTMHT